MMKSKNATLAVVAIALAATFFPLESQAADNSDDVLILSFFRGNGEAGIYLAASEDGLHFKPLNDDQPVMKPAPWNKQNLTRDPSMVFHDGKFHAVWTTSWKGNCFAYAESKDLIHWSDPVRVEPFPTNKISRNTWAPEISWDPVQQNFLIAWSSRLSAESNQIYFTRTADGKTFSEAKPLIEPGFGCIDGMMALDGNDHRVMIFKNEDPENAGGKNLRVAIAPVDFSQPWKIDPKPIVGPGSSVCSNTMTEGPSLLKTKDGWRLYWDAPLQKIYGVASSTDLTNWTDHTAELQLPPNPRHGTVFRAPRSAVGWLK